MRGHMLRRMVFGAFLGLISCSLIFSKTSTALKDEVSVATTIEDKLLNDALKQFKKVLDNKKGHLDRISYRCTLVNNAPQETAVKVYYTDYRKNPDLTIEKFVTDDAQPDALMELVYIPYKNSLSFVQKDGRGKRRLLAKQIEIPSWFHA